MSSYPPISGPQGVSQENAEINNKEIPDVVVLEPELGGRAETNGGIESEDEDFFSLGGPSQMMVNKSESFVYIGHNKEESSEDDFVSVRNVELDSETSLLTPRGIEQTKCDMPLSTGTSTLSTRKYSNILHQKNKMYNIKKAVSERIKPTDSSNVPDFTDIKNREIMISACTCHLFLVESMSEGQRDKDVGDIPGMGREFVGRLKDKGIKTAKNLYGHYLINPDGFKEYLMTLGVDEGSAGEVYWALKMWDNNHNHH